MSRQATTTASGSFEDYDVSSYTDNQKHLLLNCIKLINHGRYMPQQQNNNNMTSSITSSSLAPVSTPPDTKHSNIPDINVI